MGCIGKCAINENNHMCCLECPNHMDCSMQCDALDEYEFAEDCPDKLQLCLMCRRAYEQVMKQEKWEKETYTPEQIREIVEILMYQELMERRGKGRRQQEKTVASCTGLVL